MFIYIHMYNTYFAVAASAAVFFSVMCLVCLSHVNELSFM